MANLIRFTLVKLRSLTIAKKIARMLLSKGKNMKLINTWEELEELVAEGRVEGPALDFKKEIPSANEKIAKTICAFANATGGLIIFGGEYDDQKTRKLKSFPGVSLTPNFDSRVEQIAMNLRPRVTVELSKPINIPGKTDKVVYVLLVHPGQLQPHQMEDGRFMVRYGSQSGPLPENIIEQMYLARQHRGIEAEKYFEEQSYGRWEVSNPASIWFDVMCIPVHFRPDMIMNSSTMTNFLEPAIFQGFSMNSRETHFGYRATAPTQEWGKNVPTTIHRLVEVHHNGLIRCGRIIDVPENNEIPGEHIVGRCLAALKLQKSIYEYVNYGGFCSLVIGLHNVNNKKIIFGVDDSPYPFDHQYSLRKRFQEPVSALEGIKDSFLSQLRQAFGYRTN